MEKFRIDNAYGAVYEYDQNQHAYVFCGKFHAFNITPNMTEKEQLKHIREAFFNDEYWNHNDD